jgi:hypothetical protein
MAGVALHQKQHLQANRCVHTLRCCLLNSSEVANDPGVDRLAFRLVDAKSGDDWIACIPESD